MWSQDLTVFSLGSIFYIVTFMRGSQSEERLLKAAWKRAKTGHFTQRMN